MQNNIEFNYLDIDNEENKANFYALRDKHSMYDPIKAAGRYGIPTFVINGEPFINVMEQTDVILAKLGLK